VSTIGTTEPGKLQFPILTDPLSAFGLLIGQDVTLFAYSMPVLVIGFDYKQTFQIFPPFLSASISGGVSAKFDFKFGFDTAGIREFAQDNFRPGSIYKIFDGFFISDRQNADGTGEDVPEVTLTATLGASAQAGGAG